MNTSQNFCYRFFSAGLDGRLLWLEVQQKKLCGFNNLKSTAGMHLNNKFNTFLIYLLIKYVLIYL